MRSTSNIVAIAVVGVLICLIGFLSRHPNSADRDPMAEKAVGPSALLRIVQLQPEKDAVGDVVTESLKPVTFVHQVTNSPTEVSAVTPF